MDAKERGNQYFREQRYAEAIEEYTQGLGERELSDVVRAQLYANKAACLGKLERWKEVIECCTSALDLVPDFPKALWRRREAYEAVEDYDRALADAIRCNKVDPSAEASQHCQSLRDRVGRRKADSSTLLQNMIQGLDNPDETFQSLTALDQSRHRYSKEVIVKAGAIEKVVNVYYCAETDEVISLALSFLWRMCIAEKSETPIPPTEPIPVDAATVQARDRLCVGMSPEDLATSLRNPKLCNAAVRVLQYLGDLENSIALEELVAGIDAVESGESDGVQVLSQWCDSRRRMGKHVRAFVPGQSFAKAFEACMRQTGTATFLQSLCAEAWTLICDSDRSAEDKIDSTQVICQYLDPFWTSTDASYRSNGLMALAVLFHVDQKVAAATIQGKSAFQCIINACITRDNLESDEQHWGADALMHAMRDPGLRKGLLNSGGIEILTDLLEEVSQWDNIAGERATQAQMLKAKLVAVFGMLASHSEDTRKDVFSAVNFTAELSVAIGFIRQMEEGEVRRRHAIAMLEGLVMLSVHGSFKEMLMNSEAMNVFKRGFVRPADLQTNGQLSFMYTCVLQNLLRSRDNKIRQRKNEYPFNQMTDEDVEAMEQFYDKMPAESRPVKNGVVDSGAPELAEKYREAFCLKDCIECLNVIAQHGSVAARNLVADCFKFFCENVQRRRQVVAHGGVRALLRICAAADDDKSNSGLDAARQALAQICIITNPQVFPYSEAMDMVPPLLSLMEHSHELLQYEAALAVTNLASSLNLRQRIIAADGWGKFKNLVFGDNFRLRRAGLEGMCNLCMDDDVIEKFIDGNYDIELKIFLSFASPSTEDQETVVAVTGALAILAQIPEIAQKILSLENIKNLLELLGETLSESVEHRVVSLLASLSQIESPLNEKGIIRSALHLKGQHGFVSKEAQNVAESLK